MEHVEDLKEQIETLKEQVLDLKKQLLKQRIKLNDEKLDALIEMQQHYEGIIKEKEKKDKTADFNLGKKEKKKPSKKKAIEKLVLEMANSMEK